MAETTASHRVLANDDLLTAVFEQLDSVGSLGHVRLTSKAFEVAASPYLFSTLRLGFRKRYLRRLKRVAADRKFAKGVREIVWDTAHYATNGSPYELFDVGALMLSTGVPYEEMIPRSREHGGTSLARLRALAKDEDELCGREAVLVELVEGLRSFTGLKSVVIACWSSRRRHFVDADAILARGRTMPPPFRTLLDLEYSSRIQNQGLELLLGTLASAGRHIERMSISSSDNSLFNNTMAPHLRFPGMLINFDGLSAKQMNLMTRPLTNLKQLRLHLEDKDQAHSDTLQLHQLVGRGGLQRFLARLPKLEVLDLRVHAAKTTESAFHTVIVPLKRVFGDTTFGQLRKLTLSGFWLEPGKLCELLSRHAATLQEVAVTEVNLGGTRDAPELILGTVSLLLPQNRPHRLGALASYPGWESLAQTCQSLPKLEGLAIETPSVGLHWQTLGLFEVDDLIERGMNGRPNRLTSAGFAGLWE
ncbi:hypothetical protein LTR85_001516 [Meristemomyces frigidus]|nr:hypothetical protein LTR85_001516 [Meristemomyces frigidus]